ncbi:MAG: hypothetical protein OXM62_05990 [bacterium]|nr:hypothetical protein [bacterium]MDE0234539.1 hypothetical protein [bacterium]
MATVTVVPVLAIRAGRRRRRTLQATGVMPGKHLALGAGRRGVGVATVTAVAVLAIRAGIDYGFVFAGVVAG